MKHGEGLRRRLCLRDAFCKKGFEHSAGFGEVLIDERGNHVSYFLDSSMKCLAILGRQALANLFKNRSR